MPYDTLPGVPDHSPSRRMSPNFSDGGNFNVSDQGPSRGGYSSSHRDHDHDAFQGGTTVSRESTYPQAPVSSSHQFQFGTPASYDTPNAPQQPPTDPGMGPRHPTEFVPIYTVQSADSPSSYPLGFVRRQSPGPMNLAWPTSQSQDSAGAWDPFAGSHSHQSATANESPSPYYTPGGFRVVCQNPRPIPAAPPYQGPADVQDGWIEPFSGTTNRREAWRKAVVIGTNYSKHPDPGFRLRYCTRDANAIASFLCSNLGFEPHNVRTMTDEAVNPLDRPTKENILRAMRELIRDAQPGDCFFLYFSGHGVQIKDRDGDEVDGLDECICAMDYRGDDLDPTADTRGLIVDDVMHDILVRPLPRGCRLTVLFDSCHSGTALDLPFVYDSNGVVKPFTHPDWPTVLQQKQSDADVVSLSASKDNQRAKETHRGGALRLAFIESMRRLNNNLSYKTLIRSVVEYMEGYSIPQQPQFSTSYEIDTNHPFIV